jgi:hypothetical protein
MVQGNLWELNCYYNRLTIANDKTHHRLHILIDKVEDAGDALRLASIYRIITSYTLTHSIASKADLPTA